MILTRTTPPVAEHGRNVVRQDRPLVGARTGEKRSQTSERFLGHSAKHDSSPRPVR